MIYDEVEKAANGAGLIVMGTFFSRDDDSSVVLLGAGPGFWDMLENAPEMENPKADPVDRWSERVINAMAADFGAQAAYPFGGPPYTPFIRWAELSGRAWPSPTGMLVHDTVGLMVSYRGALRFRGRIAVPPAKTENPCLTCVSRPCVTACPVGALSDGQPYQLDACHKFLDTDAGQDCMSFGCAARRACPVSAGAARCPAQSAHHMKAFHPK